LPVNSLKRCRRSGGNKILRRRCREATWGWAGVGSKKEVGRSPGNVAKKARIRIWDKRRRTQISCEETGHQSLTVSGAEGSRGINVGDKVAISLRTAGAKKKGGKGSMPGEKKKLGSKKGWKGGKGGRSQAVRKQSQKKIRGVPFWRRCWQNPPRLKKTRQEGLGGTEGERI